MYRIYLILISTNTCVYYSISAIKVLVLSSTIVNFDEYGNLIASKEITDKDANKPPPLVSEDEPEILEPIPFLPEPEFPEPELYDEELPDLPSPDVEVLPAPLEDQKDETIIESASDLVMQNDEPAGSHSGK